MAVRFKECKVGRECTKCWDRLKDGSRTFFTFFNVIFNKEEDQQEGESK